MDVINVLEVLDHFFPSHRSPERAAEWEAVKSRIALGSRVRGIVVAQFHFGVFVDIDAGFPALLLVPRMNPVDGQPRRSMELYPAIGSTVEARVCVWASPSRGIGLTQLEREEMLGER